MNETTMLRLEYDQIKTRVSECAFSYLGKRHAATMRPITDIRTIKIRLDETNEALQIIRHGASVPVPSLEGMEHILQLLGTGYMFSERDFSHMAQFIRSCIQLIKYMHSKADAAPTVSAYASSMYSMEPLLSEIERCIHSGRVTDMASKELAKIRKKIAVTEERIKRKLDSLTSRHRSIMQENMISQRNGRYVLPIKKEFRKQVKGNVLDESGSGQTVYVEPAEITNLQFDQSANMAEESKEEMKVLGDLTAMAESYNRELSINTETVGVLDFLLAKAKYAMTLDAIPVELNLNGIIDIQGARHPLMSHTMVPLDFSIGEGYSSLIITGPNTGGKTMALKSVGLLTLMVQSGLLVPVLHGSRMAVFEEIVVDIGDGQSIEHALSTFSAHIRNMISILETTGNSTLILIDEMASGTDPGEGVGLSIALLEEFHRRRATVVATTHFSEIKHFAENTPGFQNARMEFDTETLQPLYRLRIGEAGESYAYAIALKLGMWTRIIERSEAISAGRASQNTQESFVIPPCVDDEMSDDANKSLPKKAAFDDTATKRRKQELPLKTKPFALGDSVYVGYLDRTGIVYKTEDERGNVGILIQGQKLSINKKRLVLHIAATELYPDDYDLDIVLETKENRKKRKLLRRKHVEGVMIESPPENEI
ncbi:DNA mismatch repair protein MutS [Paenibacillus polymyxa]|uniref:endonuclease MutS2 n=1 Tax=Paenibacillus polymyxa TaxID=1406 RepID=UPI0004DA13AE|nr:DNA mismatch repair protein MutS [Paenibacillus polymyxa]KEO77556.1 DNA mismatch repair protein MutS [Paenibacillus polymyxa]MCH6189822.1 DNA mismatch repair protein MutS [Paenibacillus polymyxa]WRL59402.1 DNA mismatch repair protein MutS [Paenibacillus polymyxa]